MHECTGIATIWRVATVATFGEQLPATAAEALDALDDRIIGHDVDDGAPCPRMSLADSLRRQHDSVLRLRWYRTVCAPILSKATREKYYYRFLY
jgi:hypothetical protein